MGGSLGLQTDWITWLLMAGLTLFWLASLRLVPGWRVNGWLSLLKSLYGFAWLGIGTDIVLRFSMLSYNAVEWGNGTLRLAVQPPAVVNKTLACCGLYWVLVTLGFALAGRRRTAGPFANLEVFTTDFAYAVAIPVAALSSLGFYVSVTPDILPLAMVTPVSLLANLYAVPASVVWWDHFKKPGPWWRVGSVHVLALMPAVVLGWVSPYRENLAPLLVIPVMAAIFAGRRPLLRSLVPAGLVFLLILTVFVSSYRLVKWEHARVGEVVNDLREADFAGFVSGDWAERLQRFHGFDSMLITVALVPSARPYSGRNVLINPFIRGVIPRFIYEDKGDADAGLRFGSSLWSYEDPRSRLHNVGRIAPSMPGDLFDAGGVLYLALGALIWGILLGSIEGWKRNLPERSALVITLLLGIQCFMSVERDFDYTVATVIQLLLVLVLVTSLVAIAERRNSNLAISLSERH
ncbi:MAG: hypothetical protein WAK91_19590 [Candidatus Acidiferrales bacterium]|jgi:hypothetical protein